MRILVTDAHEMAALGAIRSLGRAGHAVTGALPYDRPLPAAAWSRFCSRIERSPDPWREQSSFRIWLLECAARYDVVLPLSEAALLGAAAVARSLPAGVTAAIPPAASLPAVLSKRIATERALELGIECAPTAFSVDATQALRPPYVVRTDNRLDGERYRKGETRFVANRADLLDAIDELDERGDAWIVQERIAGYGVGAFVLRHARCTRLAFAHRRLHEVPFSGGWSALRRSIAAPELVGQAERLLDAIGFEGAAMVEFRVSAADGRARFVEINGRLWGSLALALHAGVDFPAALVDCLAGRAPAPRPSSYPVGLQCRNVVPGEIEYLSSVLKAGRDVDGVAPPPKLASIVECLRLFLDPRIRYDVFWPGDPLPAVGQAWVAARAYGGAAIGKLRRKVRRTEGVARLRRAERGRRPVLDSVLFVCHGNVCRSAFAERYWNERHGDAGRARSAGLHVRAPRAPPRRLQAIATRFGVDLAGHRSRALDAEAIRAASAVFVMDAANVEELHGRHPEIASKTWLLGRFAGVTEIADPWGEPDDAFVRCCELVARALDALAEPRDASAADVVQPVSARRAAGGTMRS